MRGGDRDDVQRGGDFLVRRALRHEVQNLTLARREPRHDLYSVRTSRAAARTRGNRGRHAGGAGTRFVGRRGQ